MLRDRSTLPPAARDVAMALARHQRRLRFASGSSAVIAGAAAAGATAAFVMAGDASTFYVRLASTLAFAVTVGVISLFAWARLTPARAAAVIEARTPQDNVVVTAEEAIRQGRAVHPVVRDALFRDAADRLSATPPAAIQPLGTVLVLAVGAVCAVVTFVVLMPASETGRSGLGEIAREPVRPAALAPGDLRVVVTPPAYTGLDASATINPSQVAAIEGSRIRLETAQSGGRVLISEPGQEAVPFDESANAWTHELTAARSRVLLIQRPDVADRGAADRLLQLHVDADRRPLVRIVTPAKDLIFGEPTGQVPIEIEARDDLAVASLSLRYTRVSGSGESFTFEEGELPVRIQQAAAGQWRAHTTLVLDRLKLADGDTVVYRAVATDRKPGADPSTSESFLIEVGRLAGVASTGFAIPEERDRQAISQQMVIIKTERLHADRGKLSAEDVLEQSQLLAVEQRMVKAEFVFMTGGHVADEVEEAAHSHEIAEGRLENAAAVELLTAIREMSRAEARLNAGDTVQALVFERAALRALQRAFDRRRYLLRTLPERTRIDLERRLTGDLSAARPSTRAQPDPPTDPVVERARGVMGELAEAVRTRAGLTATLASRVLAVDPASHLLQNVVVPLSSAADVDQRVAAARDAQRYLAEIIRARLPASGRGRVGSDPLRGRLADELLRARGLR